MGEAGINSARCGGGEPNDDAAAGALVPSNDDVTLFGLPTAGVGVLR